MLTQYSASSHQCRDLFGRWWHGNYQRPFFRCSLCLLCCAAWPSFCSLIITEHFFSPFRTYTLFILSIFWWLSLSACLGTDSFILEFCHQCTDHPYHTHIVRLNSFFNFLLFWVCVSKLDLLLWLDHLILRLFLFFVFVCKKKKSQEKKHAVQCFSICFQFVSFLLWLISCESSHGGWVSLHCVCFHGDVDRSCMHTWSKCLVETSRVDVPTLCCRGLNPQRNRWQVGTEWCSVGHQTELLLLSCRSGGVRNYFCL